MYNIFNKNAVQGALKSLGAVVLNLVIASGVMADTLKNLSDVVAERRAALPKTTTTNVNVAGASAGHIAQKMHMELAVKLSEDWPYDALPFRPVVGGALEVSHDRNGDGTQENYKVFTNEAGGFALFTQDEAEQYYQEHAKPFIDAYNEGGQYIFKEDGSKLMGWRDKNHAGAGRADFVEADVMPVDYIKETGEVVSFGDVKVTDHVRHLKGDVNAIVARGYFNVEGGIQDGKIVPQEMNDLRADGYELVQKFERPTENYEQAKFILRSANVEPLGEAVPVDAAGLVFKGTLAVPSVPEDVIEKPEAAQGHIRTLDEFLNDMELYKTNSEPSSDKAQQTRDLQAAGRGLQDIKTNLGQLFDGNNNNALAAQNGILGALENNKDNPAYQESILIRFVKKALANSEGTDFKKPDDYLKITKDHEAALPRRRMEIANPPEGGVKFDELPQKPEAHEKVLPASKAFKKAASPVMSEEKLAKLMPSGDPAESINKVEGRLLKALDRIGKFHKTGKKISEGQIEQVIDKWKDDPKYSKYADVLERANHDLSKDGEGYSRAALNGFVHEVNDLMKGDSLESNMARSREAAKDAPPTSGSPGYYKRIGESLTGVLEDHKNRTRNPEDKQRIEDAQGDINKMFGKEIDKAQEKIDRQNQQKDTKLPVEEGTNTPPEIMVPK